MRLELEGAGAPETDAPAGQRFDLHLVQQGEKERLERLENRFVRRRGHGTLIVEHPRHDLVDVLEIVRADEPCRRRADRGDILFGGMPCGGFDRVAPQQLADFENLHYADALQLQQRLERRGERIIALAADERAVAVEYLDQTERLERPDCLAHRRLADAETVGKLLLARQAIAMGQAPGDDILTQRLDDLVDDLHPPATGSFRFGRRRCGRQGGVP